MINTHTLLRRFYVTRKFGGDFYAFIDYIGLAESQIYDPTLQIGPDVEHRAWEYAVEQTGIQDIGLLCGQELRLEDLMHLTNLGELQAAPLKDLFPTIYKKIQSEIGGSIHLRAIDESARLALFYELDYAAWQQQWPLMYNSILECMCASTRFMEHFITPYTHPIEVHFTHQSSEPLLHEKSCWGNAKRMYQASDYKICFPSTTSLHRLSLSNWQTSSQSQEATPELIEQIKQLILRHESTQPLLLTDLAHALHLSERTIQQRLKELNTSFHELYQEIRMQQAQRLLKSGKWTISEVSTRLGYGDLSSFSRAFKRYVGQSPNQYKQQKKTKKF